MSTPTLERISSESTLHKETLSLEPSWIPSLHVASGLPCLEDKDTNEIPHPTYVPDDISRVQAILLRFVPVELADAIIDMAEYWHWIGVSRNSYTSAYAALEAPDSNAQWCYLVTPQIPSIERNGVRVPTTIKMVKFFVKSYESHWGEGNKGSLQGFKSWFEASILKAFDCEEVSYTDDIHPNDWFANLAAPHPKFLNECRNSEFPGLPVLNPFDAKKRWHVADSTSSSSNKEWREIVWRHDDEKGEEIDVQTGMGKGPGFNDSLSVDDRVVLMARALTPGWINTVFNVKMEVYYSLASSYL